ncbi:MAG: EFR1 family ferrodoxin [Candidatus Omnitrophota bacterium]
MNTVIFYFSATGNSLEVARDLAREMGGADLVSMVKALKAGAGYPYGRVGMVFPVYMFGLPLIVAKFLKKVNIGNPEYIFTVSTSGGLPGRSLMQAKKILKGRGIKLDCGFNVVMPGNYTPLYEGASKDKQKVIFEKEKARVKEIAQMVIGGRRGVFEEKPFFMNTVLYHLLYRGGSAQIPAADKGFWLNEKCTGCGFCEKVCPVSNILMRDARPVWLHHCEHCLACFHWCPAGAIEYKGRTAGKRRYRHPDISAADISAQR